MRGRTIACACVWVKRVAYELRAEWREGLVAFEVVEDGGGREGGEIDLVGGVSV